ncbi:hypothetical protein LINPERPRIM_LOCUS2360 [Linum perenne]
MKFDPDHLPSFTANVIANNAEFKQDVAQMTVKTTNDAVAGIALRQLTVAADEVHNGGVEKAEVEISLTAVKAKLLMKATSTKLNEAIGFYKAVFDVEVSGHTTNPRCKGD